MFIYVGSVVDPDVWLCCGSEYLVVSWIRMFLRPPGSIIICADPDPDPARYTFQLEVIWIKTACSPK